MHSTDSKGCHEKRDVRECNKKKHKSVHFRSQLSSIPYVLIARAQISIDGGYWTDRIKKPDSKYAFSLIHISWRYNEELFPVKIATLYNYVLYTKYFAQCLLTGMLYHTIPRWLFKLL